MMNDEYLWNKTGSDTEIEGLESALSAFRYHETAVPRMPVRALSLPEKRLKGFLRFGFAFAFAAAAVVVLSGAWFLFSSKTTVGQDAVGAIQLQNEPLADVADFNTLLTVNIAQPKADQQLVKTRHTNRAEVRTVKAIARKSPNEHPPVTLTAEEKYAYDQLMLALSITSSKLRIVKDKVSQIDEQNAIVEK
jgi:hypothetical protein